MLIDAADDSCVALCNVEAVKSFSSSTEFAIRPYVRDGC